MPRTRTTRRDDRPHGTDRHQRATDRRQHGTERDATPQPALHAVPSAVRIARARIAPALCVLLWLFYLVTVVVALARGDALADATQLVTTILFLVSVTLLTFSASMYLLARSGALPRFAAHRRARRIQLDEQVSLRGEAHGTPRLIALLPSRSEDPELVRMSLWSVALQEFPDIRVVLLLDDDPHPTDPADRESLDRSRMLGAEIAAELEPARARVAAAQEMLLRDRPTAALATETVMREHAAAAQWLRARADAVQPETHVQAFFADQVLRGLAANLDTTATALHDALENDETPLSLARAQQVLQRLVNIFTAELGTFERKRYSSLSHAPNKAMNLNSYLGLLGGRWREQPDGRGLALVRIDDESAGQTASQSADAPGTIIDAPDCEFVLTLDADSMLLPEYCLRLVHELDQPGNSRVAVAQTPYSAYRGAPTRVERLAGATTDLQHIVHQGFSAFGATYWVGANAVLRRSALEDIRRETEEDGVRIVRFISDRTVIEDTESTIDIAAHGWSLLNYPERLSYSATPPDFGTLVIQRRRWADGGLLILPRLHDLVVARRRGGDPMPLAQLLLRANYLGSIAWVTLGLLAVLTLNPLGGQLITVQLLLIATPYFVEMASDLEYLGYRRRDVFGIYGLNLLLLPVNLAGSLASVGQALTGRKGRFVRTPKVSTRTPAPALAVLAPLVIVAGAAAVAVRAGLVGDWGTTVFAAFTAAAAAWGITRLVGLRHALGDLWFGWLNWIWVDAPPAPAPAPSTAPRWSLVVDEGLLPTAATRERRRRRVPKPVRAPASASAMSAESAGSSESVGALR
ncbi:glycosyltransferase family 2 protein [Herbiconiux liukaitaii]|uniref:glycosyltransferase family 2 protein n=1 Tax=Herbiconiux liukaitaii TaxID=3342799 RepID=UPI0035B71AA2